MKDKINIKIGGQAGKGIKSVGLALAKSLLKAGYWVTGYTEYPSLIRGGHNTYQVLASTEKVFSQEKPLDILIALDEISLKLHQEEFKEDTIIIHDPNEFKPKTTSVKTLPIALLELVKKAGGLPIMANNVALGAVFALLNLKLEPLNEVIKEIFQSKGKEIIELNQKAALQGFLFVQNQDLRTKFEKPKKKEKRVFLTGNEAIALGALAGGLKFYSAYPMTPATSILHFLAEVAQEAEVLVRQPEDEIACINMAIGASFAGVRSMTATSGGGFSLMNEGLGLAGVAEIPLVLVNVMRPGPASGMPTWTAQGDLKFLINAAQDEFPRIVLAPGDIKEAFELTRLALLMAEKYQIPVLILSDKYLAESNFSAEVFPAAWQNKRYAFAKNSQNYQRYKLTDSGVSPRPIPGKPGFVSLTNSYDHGPSGFATEESQERIEMVDKRNRKFKNLEKEIIAQPVFGRGEVGLISWGSNKGPILQALRELKNVSFLHLNWLWPFPRKIVENFIRNHKKIATLECNSLGQLNSLIREQTGIKIEKQILKYDGRPFYPEEIKREIKNL